MAEYTANHIEIVDGMACWDNELNLVTIDFSRTLGLGKPALYFDGWFACNIVAAWDTKMPQPDRRFHIMNGERLSTRHPRTGEFASARLAAIRQAERDAASDPLMRLVNPS